MLDLLGRCRLETLEEASVGSEDRASRPCREEAAWGIGRCNSIGRKHAFCEKRCSDETWLHEQLGS